VVKKILKIGNIWESYCQKFGGFLFWNTMYIHTHCSPNQPLYSLSAKCLIEVLYNLYVLMYDVILWLQLLGLCITYFLLIVQMTTDSLPSASSTSNVTITTWFSWCGCWSLLPWQRRL